MNCYDYPQYWDLAFQGETKLEADFVDAAAKQYLGRSAQKIYEAGCGGGRLSIELARRGKKVEAIDLSESSIRYLRSRCTRAKLSVQASVADMVEYVTKSPVDVAINTTNTFRHLTSEESARRYLECVSQSLKPGGILILGFHLLPPDASLEDGERWTETRGKTRVTTTLRVLETSRRQRYEVIRFNLRVRRGAFDLKLRSDYTLRIYTAKQVRQLFASVPALKLCGVFDFWYEIDEPLRLSNELGDAVFVLKKIPVE